jgi:small-conductance mechanosensitive channel
MTRKTIKELEEQLKTQEAAATSALENYDELVQQAQQIQQVSANRLVFIRLLEAFANEVNGSLQKLQRDLFELQRAEGGDDENGGEG